MGSSEAYPEQAVEAARILIERLGRPALGVILGSGFDRFDQALGEGPVVPARDVPGFPGCAVEGHAGGIRAVRIGGETVWVFRGRVHLYEGYTPEQVTFPVAVLAAAGGRALFQTCATGGLRAGDRSGDLVLITDHLNLTGADPAGVFPGGPRFLDLHAAYDPAFAEAWQVAARERGWPLEQGVLAAVRGPSYETPAEVRMLQRLGADLVTMSTVPETVAARFFGVRVAAMACVANPGAGLAPGRTIDHEDVLDCVRTSVERHSPFLIDGLGRMIRLSA
ncbi:hypothetical protein ABI59_04925 [Acidobacteria bacterium Mor1]|nr:hypothetical protein ABI59_04925 [Acidobacteria bacterium Mor1]